MFKSILFTVIVITAIILATGCQSKPSVIIEKLGYTDSEIVEISELQYSENGNPHYKLDYVIKSGKCVATLDLNFDVTYNSCTK